MVSDLPFDLGRTHDFGGAIGVSYEIFVLALMAIWLSTKATPDEVRSSGDTNSIPFPLSLEIPTITGKHDCITLLVANKFPRNHCPIVKLQTHEQTINTALAEVLSSYGRRWQISAEKSGGVFADGSGRPDILITTSAGWPVVIEAEVANAKQAEKEAISRLGRKLTTNTNPVECVVALVYPKELRNFDASKLRKKLDAVTFEYAIFFAESEGPPSRIPKQGFLKGNIHDLVFTINKADLSTARVAHLTATLEQGINKAEASLRASIPLGSKLGNAIAEKLGQKDDDEGQTRKMAMVVITNALIFHEQLATVGLEIQDGKKSRSLQHPVSFRNALGFLPTPLMDEWRRILEVNYWPIFYTATLLLESIPVKDQTSTLECLWGIAEALVAGGVTKSHDMTGVIFQRLIADREVLKTFYTRPACASLLVGLAMPHNFEKPIPEKMRIGDFACGTGTLLSTAYNRYAALHEIHGTDAEKLHPAMMKDGLVGLDVLNVSVHLTAAMLAGSHPGTAFKGECLLTMPYGVQRAGRNKIPYLGSLDLLTDQHEIDLFEKAVKTAGGTGFHRVEDAKAHLTGRSFDLIVMNPPFTRSGKHSDTGEEGKTYTAFSAFEASEGEQKLLSKELSKIGKGTCADGNAGMGAYFVALAEKMVKRGGSIAFVLPLSAISGSTWSNVRELWAGQYTDILVTTISSDRETSRSFSADTGMAECLVIARKQTFDEKPKRRAMFAVISRQPSSAIEGELIAKAIIDASREVKKLEDGPVGGTSILLGDELIGEMLDCPLIESAQWPLVGISDLSLAQTAFALERGSFYVAGNQKYKLDVGTFADIAIGRAPYDLDIDGDKQDGTPRGPFRIKDGYEASNDYPCLWAHDSELERTMEIAPDSRGIPRAGVTADHINEIWGTATRLHYCRDLRFNSQSLVVAMTQEKCIGGRAWPSVRLKKENWEYASALWCNSTFGLLFHWWVANKTQNGRGSVTVTTIPSIPTLDVSKLTEKQHQKAKQCFEALRATFLLPMNQIDEDAGRDAVDRAIAVDVLGLNEDICAEGGPLSRLRTKLAAEPQIHGGKKSKVQVSDSNSSAEED